MMRRKLLGMALALAGAVTPVAGRAQVDATIGGTTPVPLPFDAVTPNPTGIKMNYYVPSSGTAPMPIVVALHGCQGKPEWMLGWLKAAADQYGFMLALPFVNRVDQSSTNGLTPTGCWDVGSDDTFANATATDPADRSSSDPAGVYALVKYLGSTLRCGTEACGDLDRVFATGQSSGGMMTNVMLGLYPDVFKAGASAMGVPYKCWLVGAGGAHPTAGTETTLGAAAKWSSACATSNPSAQHTPAEWAAMLPAHEGPWPRMLLYHGEADDLIYYPNLAEQMEQWTEIHGVGQTPVSTEVILATKGSTSWTALWTRKRYGDASAQAPVETLTVSGIKHSIASEPGLAAQLARFFGIGDDTAPAAPTGLAASAVTTSGATLTWTAPADADVTTYVVYQVDGATSTAVAWPRATTPTLALTGLSAGTAYKYEVVAEDRAGNLSAASTAVEFTTEQGGGGGGGGGGGCGQGAPSGAALALAGLALLALRRRTGQA